MGVIMKFGNFEVRAPRNIAAEGGEALEAYFDKQLAQRAKSIKARVHPDPGNEKKRPVEVTVPAEVAKKGLAALRAHALDAANKPFADTKATKGGDNK